MFDTVISKETNDDSSTEAGSTMNVPAHVGQSGLSRQDKVIFWTKYSIIAFLLAAGAVVSSMSWFFVNETEDTVRSLSYGPRSRLSLMYRQTHKLSLPLLQHSDLSSLSQRH
jgi:hypothetical protein